MDNDKLFPTPQTKADAVLLLSELKNHPGWELLCRIMEENISVLTRQLTEMDFATLEEQKEVRIKRQAYVDVRNTPDSVIQLFKPRPETPEFTADPYDTRESMVAERLKG